MRGSFFAGYANSAMQGSNFTDELRAQGLASPNELKTVWEVTPQVGGPILQDKLWYLAGVQAPGHAQLGGRHVSTTRTPAT